MDISQADLINFAYALLSGVLPALLWLWFWLKEDNLHPEPKRLIIGTFIAGAIAVFFAIIFEKIVLDMVNEQTIRYILWASIEEIIKFLAVGIIALKSVEMDEPIDAMIYCITVAVGFAAIENAFFIISPLHIGDITGGIITGNLRFIGATLVHIVSSASIGFMIGISFYQNKFVKFISIIIGITIAITLHSVFNLSIINTTSENMLKVFGIVWCMVIILLILFEEVKGIKAKTL